MKSSKNKRIFNETRFSIVCILSQQVVSSGRVFLTFLFVPPPLHPTLPDPFPAADFCSVEKPIQVSMAGKWGGDKVQDCFRLPAVFTHFHTGSLDSANNSTSTRRVTRSNREVACEEQFIRCVAPALSRPPYGGWQGPNNATAKCAFFGQNSCKYRNFKRSQARGVKKKGSKIYDTFATQCENGEDVNG